jgi:hypothetical protein
MAIATGRTALASCCAASSGRAPLPAERPGALARAGLAALQELYPGWHVWLDSRGWHARRGGGGFMESREPGAPVFSVHAETAAGLAIQLAGQQAADACAPAGGMPDPD